MSVNKVSNNTIIKPYEQYEIKPYTQNNADNPIFSTQSQVDTFQKTTQNYQENEIIDTTSLRQDLEKTKSEQGFLGKLWDGFKNITGIGAGSSKAEQAIEDYENGFISQEEMEHAVNGYKAGQKMATDVVADMASGMISIVAFGAATALMGPAGALLVAGATGTISKVGIKASDALTCGREYSAKDLLYDAATGGINGLLGPITNGIGNTVTKTIATKFGLTVLKEGAEEVAEQGIKQGFKQFAKNIVLNQTDDFIGGTLKQKTIAIGAGMAIDGALSGSADNMIRAGLNGENVLKAGAEGFVGGLIMAPIIGGGMKIAGKGAKLLKAATPDMLSNNIAKATNDLYPDGVSDLRFFQRGSGADLNNCYFLSTLKALSMNEELGTRYLFENISVNEDGSNLVRFYKDGNLCEVVLTAEELSNGIGGHNVGTNAKGIKILETAYAKFKNPDRFGIDTQAISGAGADIQTRNVLYDILGMEPFEIAANVSSPKKITSEAYEKTVIEFLDDFSKRKTDFAVVIGTKKGLKSATSSDGYSFISKHAYTLADVDSVNKTVTVIDPYDSTKSHTISYEEFISWFNSVTGVDTSGKYNEIAETVYKNNRAKAKEFGRIVLLK